MSGKLIGMLLGLGFGLAVLHYGLVAAVFLLVCAFIGWQVGRVIEGEVSLLDLLDRTSRRERLQ